MHDGGKLTRGIAITLDPYFRRGCRFFQVVNFPTQE
jgi:hypothetical protein